MLCSRTFWMITLGALVVATGPGCSSKTKEQKAKVDLTLDPAVAAEFKKRVAAYSTRSLELAGRLPKLSQDASPQQIDTNQRAFEKLLVAERPTAQQGDFFVPGMQTYVRTLLADVFADTLGAAERRAVHDEAHAVTPVINKRYPDDVPLSTMPPRLLANLPTLPDQMEYRFVFNDLVLMDVHAHLILDFITDAMAPGAASSPEH